jgi:hypothetical protein
MVIGTDPVVVVRMCVVMVPDPSSVNDEGSNIAVELDEVIVIESFPVNVFPPASLRTIVTVDVVDPSAGAAVVVIFDVLWSGGLPANILAGTKKELRMRTPAKNPKTNLPFI